MVHQLYIRLCSLHRNVSEPSVIGAAEVYSVKNKSTPEKAVTREGDADEPHWVYYCHFNSVTVLFLGET